MEEIITKVCSYRNSSYRFTYASKIKIDPATRSGTITSIFLDSDGKHPNRISKNGDIWDPSPVLFAENRLQRKYVHRPLHAVATTTFSKNKSLRAAGADSHPTDIANTDSERDRSP